MRRDPMGIRGLPDPSRSGRAVTEPQRSRVILGLWRYRSSLLNSWASSGESFVDWSLPVLCQLCWPWSSQITSLSFPVDSSKAKLEFYWKLRGSKRERNKRITSVLPSLNTRFCIDTVRLHSSTWPHLQKPQLVLTPSQSRHRALCGVETDRGLSVLLSLSPYSTWTPIHLQALGFHNSWPLSGWEKEKNSALSLPKSTSLGISSTISHLANLCPALPGGFSWSLLSGLVFLVHQNMLTSRVLGWTLLFWKQTILSLIVSAFGFLSGALRALDSRKVQIACTINGEAEQAGPRTPPPLDTHCLRPYWHQFYMLRFHVKPHLKKNLLLKKKRLEAIIQRFLETPMIASFILFPSQKITKQS